MSKIFMSLGMNLKELLEHYKDKPVKDIYNLSTLDNYDGLDLNKIIDENPLYLQYIKNPTNDIIYKAVSLNGNAIQFVNKDNSLYNSLVDVALKNNASSLQYLEQTKEIKRKAFKYVRFSFPFIKNPTRDDFNSCVIYAGIHLPKVQVDYALEKYKNGEPDYVDCIIRKENFLKYADNIPYDVLKRALKYNPKYIKNIVQEDNEELCKIAVEADYKILRHIKNITLDICKAAIVKNVNAYNIIPAKLKEEISNNDILKLNGMALKFITKPTEEEMKTGVEQNGLAVKYITNISLEVAMLAVKQNPLALRYIEYQWYEVCVEAVKNDNQYLKEIRDKSLRETVKKNIDTFRDTKICKYYTEIENEELDTKLLKLGLSKAEVSNELYIDSLIIEVTNDLVSLTNFIHLLGLKYDQIKNGRYKKIFVINNFIGFDMKDYQSVYIEYVNNIEDIVVGIQNYKK